MVVSNVKCENKTVFVKTVAYIVCIFNVIEQYTLQIEAFQITPCIRNIFY